jgi:DNA replication regulator DPB11
MASTRIGYACLLAGLDCANSLQTNILRTHLGSHGGRLSQSSDLNTFSSNDLKRGYLMVPHDAQVDLTSLPECAGSMNLVTNWWAERCLFGKSLVDPAEYTLGRPLGAQSIRGESRTRRSSPLQR